MHVIKAFIICYWDDLQYSAILHQLILKHKHNSMNKKIRVTKSIEKEGVGRPLSRERLVTPLGGTVILGVIGYFSNFTFSTSITSNILMLK